MFSKLGIFSIGIGAFIWLFSMISGFMQSETIFVGITLSSLSEDIAESSVNAFSSQGVQDILYALFYEVHLGGLIVGLGVFFLIISLFAKEH